MATLGSQREAALVERRFDSVLTVARQTGTSVGVDHISELMPSEGPEGRHEVSEWLAAHPSVGTIVGDRVIAGASPSPPGGRKRQERGRRYFAEAERIVAGPIAPVVPFVRCVAVTGSVAYGEPSENDDLDFLVVARPGTVWLFLLFSYLAARRRRNDDPVNVPTHWCFNYVLDERAMRAEFSTPRGFLFAREALMARPVVGESYYRGLVGSAVWLGRELPRLYRRWSHGGFPELPPEQSTPWPMRALNLLLFPLLASYLSLAGMVRNRRFTKAGRPSRRFRVVARLDRLSYETERFEELRSLYTPSTVVSAQGAK
jgi:hypothetical protein